MDSMSARTPEEIHAGLGRALALEDLDRLLTSIVEGTVQIVPVGIRQERKGIREGAIQMPEELPQVDWEMRTTRSRKPRYRLRGTAVLDRPVPSRPFRTAGN
jgi:hypothetical protein